MTVYKLFSITFFLMALSVPANAGSGREEITKIQVAAAMRSMGMNVSADQVTLLSDVVAKTRTPVLRVDSAEAWVGGLSRVRLDCGASDECLPFVVTVRRSRDRELQARSIPSDLKITKGLTEETPKNKIVVRGGSAAVLLLDGGHVHIQLDVICLQNGAVGQKIRVASKGHDHTYVAEVSSDGLLRGAL